MIVRVAVAALLLGTAAAASSPAPPPGASGCSGCHGPSLNGRDAPGIAGALDAYRTGDRQATVMDRIAKGFSHDESVAIAMWLEARK